MNDFWKKILAGVVTVAICANTALLLNLRDRMTRLETILTIKANHTDTAKL